MDGTTQDRLPARTLASESERLRRVPSMPARGNWFDRHLLVAAGFAFGIGVVGQLLVLWLARGELDATVTQRAAAVVYTTAFWVAVSQLLALAGCRLLRGRSGRIAALTLSSIVLGSLAIVVAAGLALRIISGSFLTAGAVMFSLNSSEHFIHGFSEGYAGWAGITLALAIAFGVAAAVALRGGAKGPCWPKRRHGVVLGLLTALVITVYSYRADSRFTKGMFVSEPLLALVSSLDSGFELTRTTRRPNAIGEPLAPPGPPLSAEEQWKSVAASSQGDRPNVVLVMLESVAPRHMSLNGYRRETTPTIDAIAKRGMYMRRAWTTATHSNYAQMAVLSSLFPRRVHGLDQYKRLDYPRFLFHDTFHTLGYDTATISSQDENWQGMRRFQQTGTPTLFWNSDDFTGEHLDSGVERIVPDDATTDVALGWLDKPRDRPFALYVNFQGPHFPYTIARDAPRPWTPDMPTWSTFGYLGYPEAEKDIVVNRYDNAIRFVDDQVARIEHKLAELGELDNTLWIFTSDHGEMFFERGLVTHGKTLNEVEARVPIILTWPGHIAPAVRDDPVSHLDIMPTVLDFLELPPHPSWQGMSFAEPSEKLRQRAIFMNIQGLRFADAVVCWPFKLIVERTNQKRYLYDLAADPDERNNLVEKYPEVHARLDDTLTQQLLAQLDYHAVGDDTRTKRFQPRIRSCPPLR
jgi:arylsulfatase A-like enzyme